MEEIQHIWSSLKRRIAKKVGALQLIRQLKVFWYMFLFYYLFLVFYFCGPIMILIVFPLKLCQNEATSKVQERLFTSSPSKTQVEIENEVFDELMYEEENPKRPIGFGFNVNRSDVFGVNVVLRKTGYTFPDNNMELKRVKKELASQKAMFLLMLKAVRNGKNYRRVLRCY